MKMQEVEQPMEGSEGLPPSVKALFVIAAVMLFGFVSFVMLSFDGPSEEEQKLQRLEAEKDPSGRDDHRELRFAYEEPPIVDPKLTRLPKDNLDQYEVIGVEVEGEAVAFALAQEPKDFMFVSTIINGRAVVVTHNYLGDQTRVFSSPGTEHIPVLLGGQDVVRDLVLLVDDIRYTQSSPNIPLEDFPYECMSLGEWAEIHPDTTVCFRDAKFEMWEDGRFF